MAELLDLIVQLLDLLGELARPVASRARHGLIRRQHQRAETGRAMERSERHHRDDRRAVGHGDDPRRPLERLRIHLGDDERHVRLHPERRRLVDAHGPGRGGLAHELRARPTRRQRRARDRRRGAPRATAPASSTSRPANEIAAPCGPRRGQRHQLVHRERALLQDAQHLGAHGTGGADDGDLQTHGLTLSGRESSEESRASGTSRCRRMSSNSCDPRSKPSESAWSCTRHAASPRTNTISRTCCSTCPASRTKSHWAAGDARDRRSTTSPTFTPSLRRDVTRRLHDLVQTLAGLQLDRHDPHRGRVRRLDELVVGQVRLAPLRS